MIKLKNTMSPKHPNQDKAKRMSSWWVNAKQTASGKDKAGTFNMELYLKYLQINQINLGSL